MKKDIKLICFDLDKTLINQNSWYTLNLAMGMTPEEDQKLVDEYFAGKFSYEEWVKKILDLYLERGKANLKNITNALSKYELADGAKEVVEQLKSKGYHIALISGSINVLVDIVAKDLGIELSEGVNAFIFDENDDLENIVTYGKDEIAKLNILESYCRKLGIDISECVCVGDGDNDIEMFKKTGKGITFRGSKIESDAWQVIDNLSDLKDILE